MSDGISVSGELPHLLRRIEAVQADGFVLAPGDDPARIGGHRQRSDRAAVPLEATQLPTGRHVPHDDDPAHAGRERDPSVGREFHVRDRPGMSELDLEDGLGRRPIGSLVAADRGAQEQQTRGGPAHPPRPRKLSIAHPRILARPSPRALPREPQSLGISSRARSTIAAATPAFPAPATSGARSAVSRGSSRRQVTLSRASFTV